MSIRLFIDIEREVDRERKWFDERERQRKEMTSSQLIENKNDI